MTSFQLTKFWSYWKNSYHKIIGTPRRFQYTAETRSQSTHVSQLTKNYPFDARLINKYNFILKPKGTAPIYFIYWELCLFRSGKNKLQLSVTARLVIVSDRQQQRSWNNPILWYSQTWLRKFSSLKGLQCSVGTKGSFRLTRVRRILAKVSRGHRQFFKHRHYHHLVQSSGCWKNFQVLSSAKEVLVD